MLTGSKVSIEIREEAGQACIAAVIAGSGASLQDLLDAWQPLCSRDDLEKKYAPGGRGDCEGCANNCCNAAFIIPDLLAFKASARLLGAQEKDYIARYFDRSRLEQGLLRWSSEPCVFLENLRCGIYPCRALLCRFYLCSPMTGFTEELVYRISWAGAAATLVYARERGLLDPGSKAPRGSFDHLVQGLLEDYSRRAEIRCFFSARSYRDIPLAPFLKPPERI